MTARLLTFLGIPVCAAILAYAVVYIVVLWLGGEPPTLGSLAYAAVFGGLALVVVVIALRAGNRDRKSGARQGLWVLIPVLLVAGGAVGGAWSLAFARERLELHAEHDRRNCATLLGEEADAAELDACVQKARDCRHETAGVELEMGAVPEGLPPGVDVSRAEDALVLACLHQRL